MHNRVVSWDLILCDGPQEDAGELVCCDLVVQEHDRLTPKTERLLVLGIVPARTNIGYLSAYQCAVVLAMLTDI